MSFQQQAIKLTKEANANLFRSARSMPEEKLNWKVTEHARTAMDVLQEVAQSPMWFAPMLDPAFEFNMDPEVMEQAAKERTQWTTIDECERVCSERSVALFEKIMQHPDNDMDRTITLPFGDGITLSMADLIMSQYWHSVYHVGQLNFIQTLYGDHDMH